MLGEQFPGRGYSRVIRTLPLPFGEAQAHALNQVVKDRQAAHEQRRQAREAAGLPPRRTALEYAQDIVTFRPVKGRKLS